MRPADLGELVRLPAALTVPGDAWTGAAWAASTTPRSWAMPLSSACLYWAGMALNDWCDRDLDATERPERPIPSGRVSPDAAAAVAGALGLAGVVGSALVGGRTALRVSAPLAALVWAYDAVAKDTVAGPLVMASTRTLDVLLGAHADPRAAWQPAAAVAVHTVGVTTLSRGEVHGTRPAVATATTAATAATAIVATAGALLDRSARRRDRLAGAALATAYGVVVGRAQAAAATDPTAATVRTATRTGIAGVTLLQAAWLARRGRLAAAGAVAAAVPALRLASRRISTT